MAKKIFDVVAIGESLRDVFYLIHDATLSCSIHKERCLLCLEYADKIPVKQVVKVPAAGNSSNASVSISRLKLSASLISWVGKDIAGDLARLELQKEHVDGTYITIDKKIPTSEATIITFQSEKTQLVYFQPRVYKIPKLPPCRAVYYSAMGEAHAKPDTEIVRQLKKLPNVFFAFQPGTTHIRAGIDALKPLIARSDIFFLNKQEAHQLLIDGDRPLRNLLERFHHLGAKIVIITDGEKGADAFDGTTHWHMPVFPCTPLERTGAGDAFSSTVTAALLQKIPLTEALRWGAANSWSVIQSVGPQTGLLRVREIKRILTRFKTIHPKIVALPLS